MILLEDILDLASKLFEHPVLHVKQAVRGKQSVDIYHSKGSGRIITDGTFLVVYSNIGSDSIRVYYTPDFNMEVQQSVSQE